MPFVKLDVGILNSTLWVEKPSRDVFITALLMAEPRELINPLTAINISNFENTGFVVPAGWYGFVAAAGIGIINRAGIDREEGMKALQKLSDPELDSRSTDFEGRRLVRVEGGFVVLNYMKFRDKDYTTAERSRRYREKKMRGGGNPE